MELLPRQRVEREFSRALGRHRDVRDLVRQGSFAGVRKFAQVVHGCLERLSVEAGLPESEAVVVTSTVLQSSFPFLLLFREGDVQAASHAVSTLWVALASGEPGQLPSVPRKIVMKHGSPKDVEELAEMFPMAVFEETTAARKEFNGRQALRRLMTYLHLSFDDLGRMLDVSGETVRRWERGVSRMPGDAVATLQVAGAALTRLAALFLPQRLPEVVRRKADLFDGSRALDWVLQGRIAEVVDRYEQTLTYQG